MQADDLRLLGIPHSRRIIAIIDPHKRKGQEYPLKNLGEALGGGFHLTPTLAPGWLGPLRGGRGRERQARVAGAWAWAGAGAGAGPGGFFAGTSGFGLGAGSWLFTL